MIWRSLLLVGFIGLWPGVALAERATIAVATNFVKAAEAIAEVFAQKTGHQIVLSSGSTGKLYAQILSGAPYDAFLAADQVRPMLLFEAGLSGPPRTYAKGALVWWPQPPQSGDGKIALAKPELAPYGAAALEILSARPDWESIKDRLVYGENVGQAFALAATGNAQSALVALSLAISADGNAAARIDILNGHTPILQDGVYLSPDAPNPVAVAFLEYLTGKEAQARLRALGYLPVRHD